MSEFRGPLPLDDRDFAEVRGKVLSKIGRRSFAIPITLAAAAVLAIVILLPVWRRAPSPAGGRRPASPSAERPRAAAPTPAVAPAEAPQPAPAPVRIARNEQPVHRSVRTGAPPSDSETQITMNIETADPNVRIIWISR